MTQYILSETIFTQSFASHSQTLNVFIVIIANYLIHNLQSFVVVLSFLRKKSSVKV